jgi:hypothetical protein
MWIKYKDMLHCTDGANSIAIQYNKGNDWYDIVLEDHYYELGGMTKEEAKAALKLIGAALKDDCKLLDLDQATPLITLANREAKTDDQC